MSFWQGHHQPNVFLWFPPALWRAERSSFGERVLWMFEFFEEDPAATVDCALTALAGQFAAQRPNQDHRTAVQMKGYQRHKYDLPSQAPHVGPHNECVNVKYKVFPIPISHLFLSFQKMRAYPSYLVAWKLRVGVYIYTDFSCQLGATPLKIYAIYVDPFRPACPVRPSLKASHVTKPLTMCSG